MSSKKRTPYKFIQLLAHWFVPKGFSKAKLAGIFVTLPIKKIHSENTTTTIPFQQQIEPSTSMSTIDRISTLKWQLIDRIYKKDALLVRSRRAIATKNRIIMVCLTPVCESVSPVCWGITGGAVLAQTSPLVTLEDGPWVSTSISLWLSPASTPDLSNRGKYSTRLLEFFSTPKAQARTGLSKRKRRTNPPYNFFACLPAYTRLIHGVIQQST